jgi:hypothetical protein
MGRASWFIPIHIIAYYCYYLGIIVEIKPETPFFHGLVILGVLNGVSWAPKVWRIGRREVV